MNPDAVRAQRFLLVRRGYDPEAVLGFLDQMADALEAAQAGAGGSTGTAVEVAEARRLVDEARTRAATQRMRAQRDIEALERTARTRRARLLAEIEELAAARDQLSDDLDRAVDVVDRVVQWVRRTDPAAAPTGRLEDAGGDGSATASPAAVAAEATREVVDEIVDGQAHAWEADPEDVPAPDGGTPHPAVPDEAVPEPEPRKGTPEPRVSASAEPAAPARGEVVEAEPGQVAEPARGEVGDAAPGEVAEAEHVRELEEPALAAARMALEAVQAEVLANLHERPHGEVDDWVPSPARLLALDDATTDAASLAFLGGWADGAGPGRDGGGAAPAPGEVDEAEAADGGGPGPAAREALEDVRGTGALPGMGIADDLRTAIRASLERGLDAGDDVAALVERIVEVHRDVRRTTLVDAVAGVTAAARHHGLLARWRHDGVERVRWLEGEERRCPGRRCRANAREGAVAPGEPFAFGEVVPPAHAGCTCTLEAAGAGGA